MSWGKIDDRLAEHPKWVRLEREHGPRAWADGLATWVFVLCYACRNETDGAIDEAVLARSTPLGKAAIKAADTLVAVGLMDRDGHAYVLHDYGHYNPLRAELQEKRAKDSARKRVPPAPDSEQLPSGIRAESPRIPSPPARAGAGARARDPGPARPLPSPDPMEGDLDQVARAPASRTREELPTAPNVERTPAQRLSDDAEAIRQAAVAAFQAAGVPAPRACRDLDGKPWVALVEPVRARAERDGSTVLEVARALLAGFLASDRAKARGYPIGFLVANPGEYLTTRTEPSADLERLLDGIPKTSIGTTPIPDDEDPFNDPKPRRRTA